MSDQDTSTSVIDETENSDQNNSADTSNSDDLSKLLASVVNEDGVPKYKSAEDAFKALSHSQAHIKKLEEENALMKEKVLKADTAEEILNQLKPKSPEPEAQPAKDSLDVDTLLDLVDQRLSAREQAKLENQNLETVKATLKEKYGDKYADVYKAKAQELGVGVDFLDSAAKKSASAVLKLIGLDSKEAEPTPSKVKSSVNTEASLGSGEAPRKNIMYGATTQDLINEWRACNPNQS